ncbi:hypothetical protein ZEAMMB73_Zm00001d041502 [Zea mays]|uniref:Uncharacterized protein n=1 Tax=Zea mays TaxID=4577 RepID=A0A1D6MWL3_MAIZE|nr:hypothetical protein ZEAMMB73_Zm00001d041502 [Zea mays]
MAPPPCSFPSTSAPLPAPFSLCSRPLAAMALAFAPCATCSGRQGWRSAVEPLPSMGQRLLPRHLPLEQQPRQLRALAAPCFAQSSGQHHPLPPLRLKHAQPYTAQLLAAEISPTAPQHWHFAGVRCSARVKLYVMNSSEVTVAVTSPSCAARIAPRRRRVSLQACRLAKTLFACEWGTSTK